METLNFWDGWYFGTTSERTVERVSTFMLYNMSTEDKNEIVSYIFPVGSICFGRAQMEQLKSNYLKESQWKQVGGFLSSTICKQGIDYMENDYVDERERCEKYSSNINMEHSHGVKKIISEYYPAGDDNTIEFEVASLVTTDGRNTSDETLYYSEAYEKVVEQCDKKLEPHIHIVNEHPKKLFVEIFKRIA